MDMEWAKDGRTGDLFVVQARPETVQAFKRRDLLETYRPDRERASAGDGPERRREDRRGAGHVIRDVQGDSTAGAVRRLVIDPDA
jgi:pyruvate,water dikinase